jgi:hypothetical protein
VAADDPPFVAPLSPQRLKVVDPPLKRERRFARGSAAGTLVEAMDCDQIVNHPGNRIELIVTARTTMKKDHRRP